jgi:PAS domain S-box-containing protein
MTDAGMRGGDGFARDLAAALTGEDAEALFAGPPALIEFLPVAIYACDAGGRIRWFNARAAEIWGRAPRLGDKAERFCGSHRVYGLDGGLIAHSETPMAYVLRTGEPVSGRTAVVERPDGSKVTAMVHLAALRDRAGNLIGAINCFHDVTEQLREDRAARESERQLRDILDALPAAIYTTDAEGRITYYNEAAVEMSGRRPELGKDQWCVTWKLFWPDGTALPHDECPMAVALKQGEAVRGYEAVAERPDGTRVPFVPYPTPLRDAAGKLVGAINMLVDVSQRKEAETQQRLLFAELNHRIKNNMQMLYALLASAKRETGSEEARLALGEAAARVSSMAAAQTALYQSDNVSRFPARSFLDAVCASAEAACGDGISLDFESADVALSNDSAVPLALILNELITNAAKHAADAGGRGAIRVRLADEDGTIALRVEDDGPGFDPGAAHARSSGLGLVAGLSRQIGGTFAVEGGDGPGAACLVRFPHSPKAG